MSDEQDRAEQLDGDALGERPFGDQLPGVQLGAEREPMHAEDPNLLLGGSETRDESHTREWRERDEQDPQLAPDRSTVVDQRVLENVLVDGDPESGELVSEASNTEHDGEELSAEEAAVNLRADGRRP